MHAPAASSAPNSPPMRRKPRLKSSVLEANEGRPRFPPGITAPSCRQGQARAIPRPRRHSASLRVARMTSITVS